MRTARSYVWLSIIAAILTIFLKAIAYHITRSVGLLSDALESIVNLVAALVAFWALSYAAKPPNSLHPFGHSKAEYFSSGIESVLIVIAALSIGITAWDRLWHPQPLEQVDLGLALSMVAAAINGIVAWILLKASRRLRSITLKADAHHLLTDVWTSGGVLLGILLIKLTGWLILDPLIAILVALNITWTGIQLLRQTASELLDQSLPSEDQRTIQEILQKYDQKKIQFHALRTRLAGNRRFITFHLLVPGEWSVKQGHDICEEIELAMIDALPGSVITSHLEPIEDPVSWEDQELDRPRF
ncbi:MAG: cation diffusion facilitator family transporter [Pseudanabaenaceae cyanobacterium]|jgi:cation diffusion facilitator family transporter